MTKHIKSEKEREKIIDFMKKERILLDILIEKKIQGEDLIKRILLNQINREIDFKLLCL